eukprot:scaffold1919_cov394-Prasinococcus_capsulatus_cf.AAC.7
MSEPTSPGSDQYKAANPNCRRKVDLSRLRRARRAQGQLGGGLPTAEWQQHAPASGNRGSTLAAACWTPATSEGCRTYRPGRRARSICTRRTLRAAAEEASTQVRCNASSPLPRHTQVPPRRLSVECLSLGDAPTDDDEQATGLVDCQLSRRDAASSTRGR